MMQRHLTQDPLTKTLSISLSEKAEQRLRQRAVDEGLPLEEFARAVLECELAAPTPNQSSEAWVAAWHAWTASRQKRDVVLDDSRESIYE